MTTRNEVLIRWIGRSQRTCVNSALRGEEREFFVDRLDRLARTIEQMPMTGQTDGQGDDAIAHLHYFAGGTASWYITERDIGSPDDATDDFQSQAFGLADLFGDGGELGYISIPELLAAGAEIDLHFEPKSLREIRKVAGATAATNKRRVERSGMDVV